MAPEHVLPSFVDTIIVGNGPSALILSYILHGRFPRYDPTTPHPDPLLHVKLKKNPDLLNVDYARLTEHFAASRLSYSTQSLPVNVLLDTLLRPLADTATDEVQSRVEWHFRPESRIPHLVLGNTSRAGGQWADNPVAASWDIGCLSYAEMLSLPGYTFAEHHRAVTGSPLVPFTRPTRRAVADYFATYPSRVGIDGSVYTGVDVEGISRTPDGFYVRSHKVHCKHLVLASGIFSHLIAPRPLLRPLLALPSQSSHESAPILVVGSGFTAADIILSTPPSQKIIHIFKWAPDVRPSPLRGCHQHAYPEYAGVYRRMKLAALEWGGTRAITSPMVQKKGNPFFKQRDWESVYEGFPNTLISAVSIHGSTATVSLRREDGSTTEREISGLRYAIGRRGSMEYLDADLQREVLVGGGNSENYTDGLDAKSISGKTLRNKAEISTEVAPDVFITGSLTGDSLVRFAFGGCVYAAGKIITRSQTHAQMSLAETSESRSRNGVSEMMPAKRRQSVDVNFDDDIIEHGRTRPSLERAEVLHPLDFDRATVTA